jgi:phosphopantetheine adenylyltransferase
MEHFISLLGTFGLGGILVALFQTIFERRKRVEQEEHDLKYKRYLAIIVLMLTQLNPETLPKARMIRPDLKNMDDVQKEIEFELLNGILFANDNVIKAMTEFSRNPMHSSLIKTVVAMRRDLWGKKTTVNENILEAIQKDISV